MAGNQSREVLVKTNLYCYMVLLKPTHVISAIAISFHLDALPYLYHTTSIDVVFFSRNPILCGLSKVRYSRIRYISHATSSINLPS